MNESPIFSSKLWNSNLLIVLYQASFEALLHFRQIMAFALRLCVQAMILLAVSCSCRGLNECLSVCSILFLMKRRYFLRSSERWKIFFFVILRLRPQWSIAVKCCFSLRYRRMLRMRQISLDVQQVFRLRRFCCWFLMSLILSSISIESSLSLGSQTLLLLTSFSFSTLSLQFSSYRFLSMILVPSFCARMLSISISMPFLSFCISAILCCSKMEASLASLIFLVSISSLDLRSVSFSSRSFFSFSMCMSSLQVLPLMRLWILSISLSLSTMLSLHTCSCTFSSLIFRLSQSFLYSYIHYFILRTSFSFWIRYTVSLSGFSLVLPTVRPYPSFPLVVFSRCFSII